MILIKFTITIIFLTVTTKQSIHEIVAVPKSSDNTDDDISMAAESEEENQVPNSNNIQQIETDDDIRMAAESEKENQVPNSNKRRKFYHQLKLPSCYIILKLYFFNLLEACEMVRSINDDESDECDDGNFKKYL